jgi:hypothetical protein
MKRAFLLFCFIAIAINFSFAQEVRTAKPIPTNPIVQQNPNWGGDITIMPYLPIGQIAGTIDASGTIFIAVNDTLSTTNCGIVIFQSTNNGLNWSFFPSGVTNRVKFDKLKMVHTGADSCYLFFQYANSVYIWNFKSGNLHVVVGPNHYRDFDVAASQNNNGVYISLDSLETTGLYRYGSVDGFSTVASRGYMTSTGAMPKVFCTKGDTVFFPYMQTGPADTLSGTLRVGRYKALTPGVLSSTSPGFQDMVTEAGTKSEFLEAAINGTVWYIYTLGTTGNLNIRGRQSTDNGNTFATAVDIAANPNVDEYWMDINTYSTGFDLIYYSDSLQSGTPTNGTDKIAYSWSSYLYSVFATPTFISNHPPFWSSANFKPIIIELPSDDLGVVWVGMNGSGYGLYFNRYSLVTNIGNEGETPATYSLSQNYPNPFNPTTKISFSIPKGEFVSLKVYDLLGREVSTLVNKQMTAGKYSIDFDASKLSSGVYFYKLNAGNYSETKKMIIQK